MSETNTKDAAATGPGQELWHIGRYLLMNLLPKAGMKLDGKSITGKDWKDVLVCQVMRDELHIPMKKREVQTFLTELVNLAKEVAGQFPPATTATGEVIDNSKQVAQFLTNFRNHPDCAFRRRISRRVFEQLFFGIVSLRRRSIAEYPDSISHPNYTSHLSRAVDGFLAAAWFWNEPTLAIMEEKGRVRREKAKEEHETNRHSLNRYYEKYRKRGYTGKKVERGGVEKSRSNMENKTDKDKRIARIERGIEAMDTRSNKVEEKVRVPAQSVQKLSFN